MKNNELNLKSLKICQLCAVDFTLEKFLLPLIDGMHGRGWEVHSVCSSGPSTEKLRSRGYVVHDIKISRSLNPLSAVISVAKLIKLFRKERYDVVHVHTPVAALVGRLAAFLCRVPLIVYTAHGFYFHDGMPKWKSRFFIFLERLAGFATDLIFTQSAEDARVAIQEKILPEESILAIGNGVSVARFSPELTTTSSKIRSSLGIPEDAFVVGLIGRLVREKGIVDFLEAAKIVAGKDKKIWFLLVGDRLSSDHADDVIRELAQAQKDLQGRLVHVGLRNDIPEMISVMNLFCLPSWREGMPRTIIEAMMMSKPVVATNIRGSREEVVHGMTGLLVPVKSPVCLAEAINYFASSPSSSDSFGKAGRERALMLYDEDKVVNTQLDRLWVEIVERGIA